MAETSIGPLEEDRLPRLGRYQYAALPHVPQLTRRFWRRRPDLNRGWRFCRPLPYHLATAPVGTGDRSLLGMSGRVY